MNKSLNAYSQEYFSYFLFSLYFLHILISHIQHAACLNNVKCQENLEENQNFFFVYFLKKYFLIAINIHSGRNS